MFIKTKAFQNFKRNYMLMIPLTIVLQSCLGSIAAMFTLIDKGVYFMGELTLIVILCMAYNAAILAQQKVHFVFKLLVLSLAINLGLLLIHLP